MYSSTSTSSQAFQGFLEQSRTRRLLLQSPVATSPSVPENNHDPSEPYTSGNTFDANVVMVLSVLLCALICSLGLNSIIRCALRCSNLVTSESRNNARAARLANTGVKPKALRTYPTVIYSAELKLPGLDTECPICLSQFAPGNPIRLLPKCYHGYHVRCIDKWLSSHSSCPKCRHCLIETCQKIVGCSQAVPSELPLPVRESTITIAPVEPESFIPIYRVTS